jgi:hypothetical protein
VTRSVRTPRAKKLPKWGRPVVDRAIGHHIQQQLSWPARRTLGYAGTCRMARSRGDLAPRDRMRIRSQIDSGDVRALATDEFVAATGYARKYAIRVLGQRIPETPGPILRPRPRRYGPTVVEALTVAWAATNYICAKRLVPFLPDLVSSLERHGHLTLNEEMRRDLLQLSPATADRLLHPARARDQPRGIGTTKAGRLLKHQVPIRTFAEWNDVRPGFLEADSVAHCGTVAEGSYLSTLTLTDIATGWTECLPLLHRSHDAVLQALDHARRLLPFPVLGLDTENGAEFLNYPMLAYCAREGITFTRGRTYHSNDQCYVEQKNGTIVRQLVGYDRLDGERAYRQLAELYRAVWLYVNFFQPSLKLAAKRREGQHVYRRYEPAQTPLQRLFATGSLDSASRSRLMTFFAALDPVRLLHQLTLLQEALWRRAVVLAPADRGATSRFQIATCGPTDAGLQADELSHLTSSSHLRKYHRTMKSLGPRTYRTRADPFAGEWDEIQRMVAAAPERTVKSIFTELQARAPHRHPDGQLRTLQRGIGAWRAKAFLTFNDGWLDEDAPLGITPGSLQAQIDGEPRLRAMP